MRISDWSSDVCSSDLSGDVPTLSQQLFNRVLHGRCVVIVIHRDHDGIDVLIALETALDGLDRHDDDVILVAAKAALPAGGENANDFAAYILQADSLADRKIGRASCRERVCQCV